MLDSFAAFAGPLREPLFVVVAAVRPHPSITSLLPWSPFRTRILSIGQPFSFQDEIYAFTEPYSRTKLRVLLSIDYPNSPDVVKDEETLDYFESYDDLAAAKPRVERTLNAIIDAGVPLTYWWCYQSAHQEAGQVRLRVRSRRILEVGRLRAKFAALAAEMKN